MLNAEVLHYLKFSIRGVKTFSKSRVNYYASKMKIKPLLCKSAPTRSAILHPLT